MHPLSSATEVTYRLPGQSRGSPHKAIIPGKVTDPDAARRALEPLLGPVEAVQIVEMFYRPTVVVEDAGDPAPLTIPLVGAAATGARAPRRRGLGDRPGPAGTLEPA